MTFQRLFIVDDVFELSGRRSVVLAPGIPRAGDWRIRVGDRVRLHRPDGSKVDTAIGGIEVLSPPSPKGIPIMLGNGMTKDMVPPGTEVWVLQAAGDAE